jgi:hypothetical protein
LALKIDRLGARRCDAKRDEQEAKQLCSGYHAQVLPVVSVGLPHCTENQANDESSFHFTLNYCCVCSIAGIVRAEQAK